MTMSSGPARVDFHHHIFPSGELAESLQTSLVDVDTYFADRPELLTKVMYGNAHTLLPRLAVNTAA
jgi:hypothetical protein